MKRKTKLLIIFFMLVFITATGVKFSYPALRDSHRLIIRIAFMNGYLSALNLKMEEIKKLKEDKSSLPEKVKKAAESYLNRVYNMNQEE
ncbi:hypothetical protein ACFL9T_13955 [Thermodesulfobacteriota bacterium]